MFGAKLRHSDCGTNLQKKHGKTKVFSQDMSEVLGTRPPVKYRYFLIQESKLHHGSFGRILGGLYNSLFHFY